MMTKEELKWFETFNSDREDKVNTVPQIFINDEYVGGFNDLYKYFQPTFDYEELMKVTERITKNLDKVVDINYYPVIETKRSNIKHRPW